MKILLALALLFPYLVIANIGAKNQRLWRNNVELTKQSRELLRQIKEMNEVVAEIHHFLKQTQEDQRSMGGGQNS